MRQEFETCLEGVGPDEAWTCIQIPFSVEQVFGMRTRLPVAGTMNGFPFRSSLFPNGDGTHHMMVNKAMKAGAKAKAGDTVRVVLEPDTAPRTVETPPDLASALATSPEAQTHYERMAYSHKKEYVDWIESAKRDETRARRVEQAVTMMAGGKRLKS